MSQKISQLDDLPPYVGIVETTTGRICVLGMEDETALILQDGNLPEAFKMRVKLMDSNRFVRVRIREADPGMLDMLLDQHKALTTTIEGEEDTKLQSDFLNMIGDAMRQGASDVHIELHGLQAKVRFRVHGRLKDVFTWAYDYAHRLSGVAFAVTAEELDGVTFNPRVPQFALVDKVITGTRVRLRLNSIPASPDGYDVIIRILPIGKDSGNLTMAQLGYNPQQETLIRTAMAQPSGVLVVSGTTGSGKSTTLNVLLTEKLRNEPTLKLITIEDPPEYYIAGATQVPVTRRGGDSGASAFAATMRAVMRCDPDIIMVGEVRDDETAKLLQQATLTGHKTLTTIHTSGVATIVPRLEQLGVERHVMGSKGFFSGLMYQRLLGLTCEHCWIPLESEQASTIGIRKLGDAALWDAAKLRWEFIAKQKGTDLAKVHLASMDGCSHCSHGAKGRTVAAEVLVPDEKTLAMIAAGDDASMILHWRRNGGMTVGEHALSKVLDGTVCPLVAEAGVGQLVAPETPSSQASSEQQKISNLGQH